MYVLEVSPSYVLNQEGFGSVHCRVYKAIGIDTVQKSPGLRDIDKLSGGVCLPLIVFESTILSYAVF